MKGSKIRTVLREGSWLDAGECSLGPAESFSTILSPLWWKIPCLCGARVTTTARKRCNHR